METIHEQLNVPVSRLIRDDGSNVRKRHSQDSVDSMKASILAHGIIQPIAVRPPQGGDVDLGGQLYRVFAGGRRFKALTELLAEKKIGPDYAVPIIVREVDDGTAAELSLAENIIRRGMEPADEFRAFKRLADDGMSVADIALRFGQTERFVRGRLALGNVHPVILASFEDGSLSFEAVAAYTLQPDPELQLKFFNEAPEWQRGASHNIKSAMRGEGIQADSSLADFIGEERYLDAGGVVQDDLFGDRKYWLSADIISNLRKQRIDEVCAEKLAEGWSFFATTQELGVDLWSIRTLAPEGIPLSEEETARMDELAELLEGIEEGSEEFRQMNAEYDALDAKTLLFSAEQKSKSGVVLEPERLHFRYGCLRPQESGTNSSGSVSTRVDSAKPERDPLALTAGVLEQIGKTATEAFAASVAEQPDLALSLLATMLELGDNHMMGRAKPSRIKIERRPGSFAMADEKGRSFETTFKKYAKLDSDKLKEAIAKLVSGTIDLTEAWFQSEVVDEKNRTPLRRLCFDTFGTDPTPAFDALAFFDGSRKPVIEAAMQEMTGHGSSKAKKGDMAKEAAEYAAKTGWLPEGLRFKGYKLKKVA